ncbi:MAG: adenylate/guanylate cyclase domain-containing protein [Planctomycetota bacterium]|nr:adenylate/guanylate cyclase domain-containing protein [Planctomycetota bacterium]
MVQRPDQLRGNVDRLWRMIQGRKRDGADKAMIDQRIWDVFGEDWAIMFTDLSGFSRYVADAGIIDFLEIIHDAQVLLLPVVEQHAGVLIFAEADSFLFLFRKARRAVECAVAMQAACADANKRRDQKRGIHLCVGIGYGEILRIGAHDVYGAEVNASSKLGEDTAKAGEILLTHGGKKAAGDFDNYHYSELDLEIPGTDKCFKLNYS